MGRGIQLSRNKNTKALKPVRLDHVKSVTLLMRQHIGALCVPCVRPGEYVRAGQIVGDTEAPIAAPVHASVSGTVKCIDSIQMPDGETVEAVVIESDGEMNMIEAAAPIVSTREEFFAAVRASGLMGLGGAGFPTHAKLRAAADKANILLVNAAECEPYLTADHREILDGAANIIAGIEHICKWLDIREAVIGAEEKDAVALLQKLCAEASSQSLSISAKKLPSSYPQGAEKMLVHSLTKRKVPPEKLPFAVGALVVNVASAAFLGRYFRTGRPLISRAITLDGGAIPEPVNIRVPIGASMEDILRQIGNAPEDAAKMILGGPMMGAAIPGGDAVIGKCNNAVLLFDKKQAELKSETACIRCGKCAFACPMHLQPLKLERAWQARNTVMLDKLGAPACMECGCCAYVCPAGRELVQRIRLGKQLLRAREDMS